MKIEREGFGRRISCPLCNCMFIADAKDFKAEAGFRYASISCPQCNTTLTVSLTIEPKMDVYIKQ